MNFLKPRRLEDLIVSLLIKGEKVTTTLLEEVRLQRKNTTKQGFYASLRKLKQDEIILIYKKVVSLNTVWIKKMRDTLEKTSKSYTVDQDSFDVLGLEDKESLTYTFSTIKNLDIFWGHSQNILMHDTPASEPIFSFDPYYWLYIARIESEKVLLKEIVDHKRQFLMLVSNKSALDTTIKQYFNNDYLQYAYKNIPGRQNYYATVIGDYITEVFLDEVTSEKINSICKNASAVDEKTITSLRSFLDSKVRSKIKISRNKSKAEKMKKRFAKEFYILKKSN